MADVYTHLHQTMIHDIDKMCVKFHATRSDMIKYCIQEMLPKLRAMHGEEKHKLMRAFENNEALLKPPVDTSEF